MAKKVLKVDAAKKTVEELQTEMKAALDDSPEAVLAVFKKATDEIVGLAGDVDQATGSADKFELQLEEAKNLLKAGNKESLPEEVRAMVKEKVAAGLPYNDALDVALRQHAKDKADKK